MKLKDNRGSILVTTIVIFMVIIVFASFTMSFMVTENKQAIHHQNRGQAYYIARGGAEAVEAAILGMDEDGIDSLVDELTLDIGGHKATVTVSKEGQDLLISSVGEYNGVKRNVEKVLRGKLVSEPMKIEYALFATNDITINNGTIDGDISTNKSINIDGNPNIQDVYLLEGQSITAPKWWITNWKKNHKDQKLISPIDYPLLEFPKLQDNDSDSNFSLSGTNTMTIYDDTNYNVLTISNSTNFYIDTSAGDIVLNIKKFDLPQGHIHIIGGNKVKINVGELKIGGGSTINNAGNSKSLIIHHYGSNGIKIAGKQRIKGDLYIEKADLTITGGGKVYGNIFSNGNKVDVTGGGSSTNGILYAPSANLSILEGGKVEGAVVVGSAGISGGGNIQFNPSYIDGSTIPSSSSTSKVVYNEKGYFK